MSSPSRSPSTNSAARRQTPRHWRRGRQWTVLGVLCLAAALTFPLRETGSADHLDRTPLVVRFTLRQWLKPPQPDPNIVLVDMDDKSADAWPEPFIGWGGHIADAINNLHRSGARVICLDWSQGIDTSHWFPGNDEKLAQAIGEAGNVVMIEIARPDNTFALPTPQLMFSLDVSGYKSHLGYAELAAKDQEESVKTAMNPFVRSGSEVAESFAARTVEQYFGAPARISPRLWEIPGKASLPLRSDGTAIINYTGNTGEMGDSAPFHHFSLVDVANLRHPDPRLRGKIAVIGSTMTGFGTSDQRYPPFYRTPIFSHGHFQGLTSKFCAGSEIQANEIRTLLLSRPIREPNPLKIWLLSILLASVGPAAFYWLSPRSASIACLLAAALWVLLSIWLFTVADYALPITLPLLGLLISGLAMGLYRNLVEERELREVTKLWGRYQDPRLVDFLLENRGRRGGEGDEVNATILFADLKNFTKTVEKLSPTETLVKLNSYLALLNSTILDHGGFVDKYLGDGLMAHWGVVPAIPDHADKAVQCCIDLMRHVHDLTAQIQSAQDVTFGVRLTVHTGPVLRGWVGASRLEYTVIGDTVNVTSRLQETAKELDCEFLISETTYNALASTVSVGVQTEVPIRGRQQPLRVYQVLDGTERPHSGSL